MKNKLVLLIASGGGIGFIPLIPGTIGSLEGILILLGIPAEIRSDKFFWLYYFLFLLAFTAVSILISHRAEKILGKSDPKPVVIDEIVGFLFTMFLVPINKSTLIAGFILSRFFDIVKPYPASYFNRMTSGGWGIVMDDVIAGIYACISLHLINILFL